MEIDDLDSHICLQCQKHIIGLPNYVQHKKYDCPMKKNVKATAPDKLILPAASVQHEAEAFTEEADRTPSDVNSIKYKVEPDDKICLGKQQPNANNKLLHGPVKRKVGRPRKHINAQAVQEQVTNSGEKSALVSNSRLVKNLVDEKAVVESDDAKTGNSRQNFEEQEKKIPNQNETGIKGETAECIPRRRGRPRKRPLEQDGKMAKTNSPSKNKHQTDTIQGSMKRRVGRPRKIKLREEDQHVNVEATAADVKLNDDGDVTSYTSPTSSKKRNVTSPKKRHERYNGSDLYKPRLSFGGSRQHAREGKVSLDIDASSLLVKKLAGFEHEDEHHNSADCMGKNNYFTRTQKSRKSSRTIVSISDRTVQDSKSTSFEHSDYQSQLIDSKHQAQPPPEPAIISHLCQLRLHCCAEVELDEPMRSATSITDQIHPALRLVNLLNELNFESDYEGLDYLPDIDHSDVGKHKKDDGEIVQASEKYDISGEDTTNATESSAEPKANVSGDLYKVISGGYSFVLMPRCQNCNRPFINALAYHSHIKSAHCCDGSKQMSCEKTASRTQADQLKGESEHKPEVTQVMRLAQSENLENIQENSSVFKENCPGCHATFNNKYVYCKHLLHALCLQETQDAQLMRLILPLKSYQCHLCIFYTNSHGDFLKHISSLEHSSVVDKLVSDMVCADCHYTTNSKKDIYMHFQLLHEPGQQSDTPYTLREKNEVRSCRFCGKAFCSSRAMGIHTATEPGHMRGGWQSRWCDLCKKAFSTTSNLQQHFWRVHNRMRKFNCNVCKKSYSYKNNLDMHYKSQMHRANVCTKTDAIREEDGEKDAEVSTGDTASRTDFGVNSATAVVQIKQEPNVEDAKDDGSEEETITEGGPVLVCRGRGRPRKDSTIRAQECKIYNCELCGYTLYSLKQFEKHQQSRYHIRTEEDAAKLTECFTCSVCHHKFYCKERFALHALSHSNKPKQSGIGLRRTNRLRGIPERFHKLALSLPKKVKSDVKCPECEVWFKANTIIPHIRYKHGDGNDLPYKCNFCSLSFASNSSLYRHHKRHIGLLSFKCQICTKGFRSKSDLESHELTFHKDELQIEAKLQCCLCEAEFMQQSKLNTHMKEKHEKVRKYWCTWPGCHRAFVHQQEYVVHMRGHTGEKPYLCDHCGFATKSKVQLVRHERIHRNVANYKCKYCSYTSRMSAGLRRHMRLHTGSKPYRCPHCEHRCYSHTNLRLHINNSRLHPGLKLYNCRFCQFASNATTEFLSHMFEAHGSRPEVIGNVAEYCGVYIPQEDVTEVKEGCEPIQLAKRKPRCKVSNSLRLTDGLSTEAEVVMKVESDVNNLCMIESSEAPADQVSIQQELREGEIITYEQLSPEKTQILTSGHDNQQYKVLSIMETPDGNIMVVNEHPMEEQLVESGHQAQPEQNVLSEDQVMETVYIPKVEKEEVIQANVDQEESSIVAHDDPSQHMEYTEDSQSESIVYVQEQEPVAERAVEQMVGDVTEEDGMMLSGQNDSGDIQTVKEVYLTSEGIQLTELIQGLEDTGAVVELRMEGDYDIPDGKPGQVIQVIGDDNKPVHFYYV